jgi:hypothetical protein
VCDPVERVLVAKTNRQTLLPVSTELRMNLTHNVLNCNNPIFVVVNLVEMFFVNLAVALENGAE